MTLWERWMAGGGCLLLWLLPTVLQAQPSREVTPRPLPCQQSLVLVSCRGLGLRTFPEKFARGVKQLDLSNNFIQNLTKSATFELGQLEHLDLSFNQLETVSKRALAHLTRLRSLFLGANHFDRHYLSNGRAFRSLVSLNILDLSANNLDSTTAAAYFSNLTSLEKLVLSGNKITQLPRGIFWAARQLKEINLSNNFIVEIEEGAFEALVGLQVINLAMNSLHCISGFSLTHLRILNLSYNALELFATEGREEQYELQVLDLSHNKLRYFPLFSKASRLTHLNLSDNAIASWASSPDTAAEVSSWYDGTAIFNLSLSNSITTAGMAAITNLDLSNNKLTLFPIDFLRNLSSLHNLRLATNCLHNLTLEPSTRVESSTDPDVETDEQGVTFLSVRSLDLQGNFIRSLPPWFFSVLPKLETVDLGSNSIQPCKRQNEGESDTGYHPAKRENCTAFCHVPQLKHLSLRRNNITALCDSMFYQTSLVSLDLSGNEGLSMPRGTLEGLESSLQKLSLRGNLMETSKTEFPCLKALKVLDLSENKLSLLPSGLACSPLENMNIQKNNLHVLEKATAVSWSRSLQSLSIADNPFSCCALSWLEVLEAANVSVLDLNKTLCSYQDKKRNFTAQLSQSPQWLCPQDARNGSMAVLLVVVIGFCFLGLCCAVYCHQTKDKKMPRYLGFLSNRVDPVSYPTNVKRMEQIAAECVSNV